MTMNTLSLITIEIYLIFSSSLILIISEAFEIPQNLERVGRLFHIQNEETEIELELGVSVPFLKIPIKWKKPIGGTFPPVTINTAGALIGTTLLVSSVILTPLLSVMGSNIRGERKSDINVRHERKRYDNEEIAATAGSNVTNIMSKSFDDCSRTILCWLIDDSISNGYAESPYLQSFRKDWVNRAHVRQYLNQTWNATCENTSSCELSHVLKYLIS